MTSVEIFHILKAFRAHSLILSPDQACERGRIMRVIHAVLLQFPNQDEWRIGLIACISLPGEGGDSAHTACGLEPPTPVLRIFPWVLVISVLFVSHPVSPGTGTLTFVLPPFSFFL